MRSIKLFAGFLGLTWAFQVQAFDQLVEKRSFSMPSYTTVTGQTINDARIGYETYGTLNAAKSNAILVPHFFSGNSHVAGRYKADDPFPGYWDSITGPGRPLDTDKYFIIGVDSLCNLNTRDGVTITTGPASIVPGTTDQHYGLSFPVVQIRDFVNLQKALIDNLGIEQLHAVIGLSMGGIQSWEWAASYPHKVQRVIAVVTTPVLGPYTIATLQQWANAVMLDPKWNKGDYYGKDEPIDGLTLAFKLINLEVRQPDWADSEFDRRPAIANKDPGAAFANQYAVENWLEDVARKAAKKTDANQFICLVRANQLFQAGSKPTLEEGLAAIKAKVLLIPDHRDLLLFPEYSRRARDILQRQGNTVEYFELSQGSNGHLDGISNITDAGETISRFLAE